MNILAIDIGGKTRNGFALINSETMKLLSYSFIPYDTKKTPLDHRNKIVSEIHKYLKDNKVNYIVFEKINLFRGASISRLSGIISLCRVQTTIINNFSDLTNITEIDVRKWKASVLGSANADKDDAVNYVTMNYPDVDLKIPKYVKKDPDAFSYNHDLADAICIGCFSVYNEDELKKNLLNYT